MPTEIERKFLVTGDFKSHTIKKYTIRQGYLSSVPERSVRIRIKDNHAYLTIKGKSSADGTTRFEWEKEITLTDAQQLLTLCEKGIIEKARFIIPASNNLLFEVDEFYGENEGLVVAEIELPNKDLRFDKPEWLGKEITGDPRYYNAALSRHPFLLWMK